MDLCWIYASEVGEAFVRNSIKGSTFLRIVFVTYQNVNCIVSSINDRYVATVIVMQVPEIHHWQYHAHSKVPEKSRGERRDS